MESQKPETSGLYSVADIVRRGNFSRAHLYKLIARHQFPAPAIRIGTRFTRWGGEVDIWFADPAGWIASHAGGGK